MSLHTYESVCECSGFSLWQFLSVNCWHCLNYSVVMFRKVWHTSNFVQVGTEYRCGWLYMYMQGSPVEIQLKYSGTRLATAWLPHHRCFHPTVFLCHLQHTFNTHFSFCFYFPGITWVRRNCVTLNFISEEVSVQGCYFLFFISAVYIIATACYIYLFIYLFIHSFLCSWFN
jgi:hypothetical protein